MAASYLLMVFPWFSQDDDLDEEGDCIDVEIQDEGEPIHSFTHTLIHSLMNSRNQLLPE